MTNFVIIALGCNLGNKINNLTEAYQQLSKVISIKKISSIYQSKALLPNNAPESWNIDFFNCVLFGNTHLSALNLLNEANKIEENLGKDSNLKGKWAPRPMDIDIIAFNDEIINSENLNIPHKEMLNRDFVMLPLTEILPEWNHPEGNIDIKNVTIELAKKSDIIKTDIKLL